VPEDTLTASFHEAADSIDADVWNGLLASTGGRPDNPFLEHAFFSALEQSGSATRRTGWRPRHLLLRDAADVPVGLMPLYEKAHSQGEYVFDHGWAEAFQQAGGRYYPKLQSAVPFTPVTAPKLNVQADRTELRSALLSAAQSYAEQQGISSIHATFVPQADAAVSVANGWLQRADTQYHWHNHNFSSFDDYLTTLSSRHRKITKRERRDSLDGLTVRWLSGAELTEGVWDAFFDFYMDTGSRKWGRPYLNRKFFSLLSAAMADRVLLMFAYDGDEPVAGTLNMVGADTLYGRYWGATRNVPFLHFELCYYQAIDYAIAHGLKTVEAGAQGEHKLARGYEPTATHSVHWIGHAGLRRAIEDFLKRERPAVEREQQSLERYTPFKRG
jgi:predicted N-acyltransferase